MDYLEVRPRFNPQVVQVLLGFMDATLMKYEAIDDVVVIVMDVYDWWLCM